MNDDFYIGWEDKSAPNIRRFLRTLSLVVIIGVVAFALALAGRQRLIGASVFEWGKVKPFSGILQLKPYPRLLVPRPGATGTQGDFSTYYLVAPFKFGLDREKLSALEGRTVLLKGTPIYRDNQTMVETLPESITLADLQVPLPPPAGSIRLGRQTLVGEIVDSKCFLGVMNPGQLQPHRGCAIRCISGGIPPVLVVRSADGIVTYLLLVSAEGRPINQEVLNFVAEPVQITGDVEKQGDLRILRADPKDILRL